MIKRISYYRMQENGGQSKARNCGIQMAKYDYLAFEDSDDLWRPEKLEVQMNVIKNVASDVGMVYHKFRYDLGEGRSMTLPAEDSIGKQKRRYLQAAFMGIILWECRPY